MNKKGGFIFKSKLKNKQSNKNKTKNKKQRHKSLSWRERSYSGSLAVLALYALRFTQITGARLALSVEHQTFNLRVKGSSPLLGAPNIFVLFLFLCFYSSLLFDINSTDVFICD